MKTSVFTSLRPSRRQTTGQKLCGDAVNVRARVCADLCDDRCRLHLNCRAVFTSCFDSVFVFSVSLSLPLWPCVYFFSTAFVLVPLTERTSACALSSALGMVVSRLSPARHVLLLGLQERVFSWPSTLPLAYAGVPRVPAQPEPDQLLLGHSPCTRCTESAAGRAKPSKQAFRMHTRLIRAYETAS